MPKRLLPSIATFLLTLVMLSPEQAAAKSCRDASALGTRVYEITASRLSCTQARRVAVTYADLRRVSGYRCRAGLRRSGRFYYRSVRCARGSRVVKFKKGT